MRELTRAECGVHCGKAGDGPSGSVALVVVAPGLAWSLVVSSVAAGRQGPMDGGEPAPGSGVTPSAANLTRVARWGGEADTLPTLPSRSTRLAARLLHP